MNRTHEAGGRQSRESAGNGGRQPASRRISGPGAVERPEPTLAELAWRLVERWRTVVAITAFAVLASAGYLLVVPPVYQSSVLIQVEDGARPAGSEDLTRLFDTTPRIEGEMRLLQSRTLLGDAVEALGLDVEAHPRMLPLIGAAVARRHRGDVPARAPLGLGRFGWGGERIEVRQLVVPEALVEEPLVLVARDEGRYELKTPDGAVVKGVVGTKATAGEADGAVSLLVKELRARPGTEFVVRKLHRDDVVLELQKALTVTQQGRDSGLVEVALKGTDPRRIASVLEALATTYVLQSVERTSTEAAATLKILDAKLPGLKARMNAAESALDRFNRKIGAPNLSLEGARVLARMGEVDHAIDEAEGTRIDDARRRHTSLFPEITDPAQRITRLKTERAALEAQMQALPGLELEYGRRVREVGLATEQYRRVFDRAEELRTVSSGWVGNARIAEHAAEQRRPVSPKKGLALVLSTFIGFVGGIAAVLLRGAFDEGIRDPDELEARTGVPVFGTIARSEAQRRIARRAGRRGPLQALSLVSPGDTAVEDLRALRTGVEFVLQRASNNIVLVGSAAPRAGKSFVSVNLAHLLAASGGRVLLVDGDLRRGTLHRYFGHAPQPGVSDVLLGEATVENAVHGTDDPNLDVLLSGKRVTNPAELLAGPSFPGLLERIRGRYKVVIVDTTPTLSVTDSAVIARHAGVNLFVVREREQSAHEVSLAVKRLVQNGASVRGTILNDVRPTLGRYGRSGGYRRYDRNGE